MKKSFIFGIVFLLCMSFASAISSDALLGCYDLDNNVNDYTTLRNGITVGTVTYSAVTKKTGTHSAYLNDLGAISIKDLTGTDYDFNSGNKSFCLWAYAETAVGIDNLFTQFQDATHVSQMFFHEAGKGFRMYQYSGAYVGNFPREFSGTLDTGAWHFYCWEINGTNTYVGRKDNVVLNVTTGTASDIYTGNLTIGGYAGAYSWDGYVDEIYLFNRTITDAERDFIYNSGNGKTCSESFALQQSEITLINSHNSSSINIFTALFNNSEPQNVKDVTVASYPFRTDALDYVGSHDGTVNGATLLAGGGYSFDGVNDYIQTDNLLNDEYYLVCTKFNHSLDNKVVISQSGYLSLSSYTGGRYKYYTCNSSNAIWSVGTVVLGSENIVCVSWNNATKVAKMYINSTLDTSTTLSNSFCSIANNDFFIGRDGTNYFNGTMNKTVVFNSIPSGMTEQQFVNYLNTNPTIVSRQTHTTNGTVYYPPGQIANISVYNITGAEGQYFNVTYSDWNTSNNIQLNAFSSLLSLTAKDSNGNTINSYSCSDAYRTYSTATGNISDIKTGNYDILLNCASGGYKNVTQTIPITPLSTLTDVITFINTTLNITFYYEENNSMYLENKVFIQFINEQENESINFTTTNGTISIQTIENSFYNIIYYTNTSNARSIYGYIPPSATNFNLKLFILLSADAKLVKYIVNDENGDAVEGAFINVSKYFSTGYEQVGYYKTNVNGIAGIEKADYTKYKEEVIYDNEVLGEDSYFFIYLIYGDSKTFKIPISLDYITDLIDVSDVQINLTANPNSDWLINWEDKRSTITGICVDIFYNNLTQFDEKCYNGTSGSETYNYSSLATDQDYLMQFFITTGYTNQIYFSSSAYSTKQTIPDLMMLFFLFLFTVLLFILYVFIDWRLGLIMSIPVAGYVFINTGLLNISRTYIIGGIGLTILVIGTMYFKTGDKK